MGKLAILEYSYILFSLTHIEIQAPNQTAIPLKSKLTLG
jgi:hypothetical protein